MRSRHGSSAAPKTAGQSPTGPVVGPPRYESVTARPRVQLPSGLHPHIRTFMAWPALRSIWGNQLAGMRSDVARISRAIAQCEPVVMTARPDQTAAAAKACGSGVEVIPIACDDLWMRDIGPTFVGVDGVLTGIDANFNGWGYKTGYQNPFANDAKVAAALLTHYGIPRIEAPFVTEGGALEPDGHGTLMATSSSIVNPNRNPGMTQTRLTQQLCSIFGLSTVIWFDGVRGQDITDCHIDGVARFTGVPGVVLLERDAARGMPDVWQKAYDQAASVLRSTTSYTLVDLLKPDYTKSRYQGDHSPFVAAYTNFYVANGSVFVPQYGDSKADANAAAVLRDLFPGRDIVQLRIDHITADGGGIHCATQQQPDLSVPIS